MCLIHSFWVHRHQRRSEELDCPTHDHGTYQLHLLECRNCSVYLAECHNQNLDIEIRDRLRRRSRQSISIK